MDRDTILRKIKACLALSKSSNANEAATALRQAKALMDQIGIDDHDPELLGVKEAIAPMDTRRPASWELILVNTIAAVFGCKTFYGREWNLQFSYHVRFVGLYHRAEVAAYTFNVLRRQCRKARVEYLKTLKRFGRKNKVQKADVFCLHWADEVTNKIQAFALPDGERDIVSNYLSTKYNLHSVATRKTKQRNVDIDSAISGRMAASGVVLNHGVGADGPAGQIGATLALGSA